MIEEMIQEAKAHPRMCRGSCYIAFVMPDGTRGPTEIASFSNALRKWGGFTREEMNKLFRGHQITTEWLVVVKGPQSAVFIPLKQEPVAREADELAGVA